ncbi:MAG: metallophosphoesterase [Bacilli bacterium]
MSSSKCLLSKNYKKIIINSIISLISLTSTFYVASCASKDYDNDLSISINADKEFKILHFADLHFGEEGSSYHNKDIERTLAFIEDTIEQENPDFIVLLGDNIMSTGIVGAQFIIDTFDPYKIPYTFVFGNHDAELFDETLSKQEVSSYLEESDSPYLLYKSGFIQDDSEYRYGNFSINIINNKTKNILGAFVIIDTGVYDYSNNRYQSITNEQISWYKEEINRLNKKYKKQKDNQFDVIPSITYGHEQLIEFVEAYNKAKENNGAQILYDQDISSRALDGILANTGYFNNGFYNAMKEMGSSKSYTCGHMHNLKIHVKMDNIIQGFCPQAGIISEEIKPCMALSYSIDSTFNYSINFISENIN